MEAPPIAKNNTVRCDIHGYTHDGLGVARIGNRAVFVPGGARGDTALVRFTKVTEKAVYARIEALETPSPHRAENDCPAWPQCGGCAFRHIVYEEELRVKTERVEDTLRRIGGVELCAEEVFAAPSVDGYRNKAAFPVGRGADGSLVTGFYRGRTHDIVPVDRCRLQSPEANACAAALRDALTGCPDPLGIRHLLVRNGSDGTLACIVSTQTPGKAARGLAEALMNHVPALCGVVWQRHSGQGNAILGGEETTLRGRNVLEDELCLAGDEPLRFRLSAKSFYQINKLQAERMYRRALDYAGDFDAAADLYCGAGTLTLAAAQACPNAHVTGIEIVPEAVRDAIESARRNAVTNVEFLEADAGEAACRLVGRNRPDVVFLDPPRKGLSPETAEAVLRLTPARIVYLSCDPATLARDVRRFTEEGYRVRRLTVADFFPRTAHVESVVLMERKA